MFSDLVNRLAVGLLMISSPRTPGSPTKTGSGHQLTLNLYYDDRDHRTKREFRKTWVDHVEDFDLERFQRNLRETIAWCLPRVDTSAPETCLRSEDLRPPMEQSDFPNYFYLAHADCDALIEKRRHLVDYASYAVDLTDMPGRLIVYYGDLNLEEGAMEAESDLYLAGDQPPWDTIICRLPSPHSHISNVVCWLPDEFTRHVSDAVLVQTTDSTWFIDSTDPPLLPKQHYPTRPSPTRADLIALLGKQQDADGRLSELFRILDTGEFVRVIGIGEVNVHEVSRIYRLRHWSVQNAGVQFCGFEGTLSRLSNLTSSDKVLLCGVRARNWVYVIFLTLDHQLIGCISVETRELRYPPPDWNDGSLF